MRILLLLFVFGVSFAEDSGVPLGWNLTRIQTETEEGTYEQRVFFSLKPADDRPAITVDENTAKSIRSGKANPEAIYTAQTGGAPAGGSSSTPGQEREYVYGAGNGGVAQADPILSTAPIDQRPPGSEPLAEAPKPVAQSYRPFAPVASIAPDQPRPFQAAAPAPRNTSGASGLPPVAPTPPPAAAAPAPAPAPAATVAAAEKDKEKEKDKEEGKLKILAPTINASNVAMGFGIRQPSSSKGETKIDPKTGERIETPIPCVPGKKTITTPSHQRLNSRGCHGVMITAWGAGGGSGHQSGGGAGAFVGVVAELDGKSDIVVVVGAAGGNATTGAGGHAGFPGGGAGGASGGGAGGGGGGYTGVFSVDRKEGGLPLRPALALAVAAGGGGGAGNGSIGGGGGVEQGEGGSRGATQVGGGAASGNSTGGAALAGGSGGAGPVSCQFDHVNNSGQRMCTIQDSESSVEVPEDYASTGGGGGGGGFYGGAGGAGAANGAAEPGGGGSSFGRGNGNASPAQGATPGFLYHPERGGAGAPGANGKLIVEWF